MLEITSIVVICLLCVGLWWIYFIEYRSYLVDSTRQRLFDIREELFIQGKNEVIDFDSQAYGMTRTTLNGMIQYTHELCMTRMIIVSISRVIFGPNEYVMKYNKKYKKAYEALESKAAKRAIATAYSDMHLALVSHIAKHSIVLLLVFRLLFLFAGAHGRISSLRKKIESSEQAKSALSIVDAEANQIGHMRC